MTVGYLSYSNLSVQHIIHNGGGLNKLIEKEVTALPQIMKFFI